MGNLQQGDTGHSPPYAWGGDSGVAQLPVTKELRLGCPAYVCVGGDPGIIHLQVGAAALQSCVGTICRGPGW